ncbi:MAG: Type-5 uracil-DNA glycosylase [bacterium]|nr:Type-5 uracil-DNA glycosylase [bacterium]
MAWREQVAREKIKRFADDEYWGRPLPSFGDSRARLLIVGLAPAAHGGNRTGRMFTGDRSGDWLFRALHKAGFANQPISINREDGLRLTDCYITATARCAPPQNKLTPAEMANCRPFLLREIALLKNVQVILGLGKIGFDNALTACEELYHWRITPRPKFGHGVEYQLDGKLLLMGTFHPSQQNTFTGKLTEAMFDKIFRRVRQLLQA